MKAFFIGGYFNPGGPNEVNRNLLSVLNNRILYYKFKNPLLQRVERIIKILMSNVIIFSGLFTHEYEVKLAKLLHKKIIYIMHGSEYLETGHKNALEELILKKSDLILCVSDTYRKLISSHYPIYKEKLNYLTNAINWSEYDTFLKDSETNKICRDEKRIILIGGGRTLKRNLQVCQAINEINREFNENYHVDVYGYYRDSDDSRLIKEMACATFHNVIPHSELLTEYQRSKLFVQNSEFESFSLGVVEALMCGCDVLISKNVGAQDVMNGILPIDIIQDPFDLNEIKEKILNVLNHGNNSRIFDSIDKDTTSISYSANRLLEFVNKIS